MLWQKMSDMAEFEDSGVKPGDFVCPVSGDILGKSFHGAVIKAHVTARVYGEAGADGRKEVLKYSSDGVNWDNGDRIQPSEFAWQGENPPTALKSFHYLVIVKELFEKGFELPAIVTFKGASAKNAKTLNANLLYARPAWNCWIKFSSSTEEKNGNKYCLLQSVRLPKRIVSPEVAGACFDVYTSLQNKVVTSEEMESKKEFDGNSTDFD